MPTIDDTLIPQKLDHLELYFLSEKIYQTLGFEKRVNLNPKYAISDDIFKRMIQTNEETFLYLQKTNFEGSLDAFERKMPDIKWNKTACLILTKESLFVFALCMGKAKYLEMIINPKNGKTGYDDYLNNKQNIFLKDLYTEDQLKEKHQQTNMHYFKAPHGIQPAQFTTTDFEKLVKLFDYKKTSSTVSPQIVAGTFASIFISNFSITSKNKHAAIKLLEAFLNDIFSNFDWHQSVTYKHAQKAIEQTIKYLS